MSMLWCHYFIIKIFDFTKGCCVSNPNIKGLKKYPENPAVESSSSSASSPGAHAVPNIKVTTHSMMNYDLRI